MSRAASGLRTLLAGVGAAMIAVPAIAQRPQRTFAPLEAVSVDGATAGSASERTLALLALVAGAKVAGTLRPFDAKTIDSMRPGLATRRGVRWAPAWAAMYWNGAPRADQDGALWQGRGGSVAAGAGVRLRAGPLDVSLQPMAWAAQNAPYQPAFTAPIPPDDFRYPFSHLIDLPYRFGDAPVTRLDPGNSWVELRAYNTAIGFTTANQHWGPAFYHPLVMGTEGAGYPRVFVEARSVDVGFAHATASWAVGRIESSRFDFLQPGTRSRIIPTLFVSVRPKALSTLELGATRLFHVRWTRSTATMRTALLPFKGILKSNDPTGEFNGPDHNQLASIFLRVAPAGARGEVYGEYYREDHNWDFRDLVGEPDHAAGYMLGVQRVVRSSEKGHTLVVIETANGRLSHLMRVRSQAPLHTHSPIGEGHTVRGQALATSALIGGGGLSFGLHRVEARRSSSFEAEMRRAGHNKEGGRWDGTLTGSYVLGYSLTRLTGRSQRTIGIVASRNYGLDRDVSAGLALSVTR